MIASPADRERVIGIDIGTTNACVAVVEGGVPMVIPNSQGQTLLPVMVSVSEQGRRVVGHLARRQAVIFAENTATGLKRLIGRKYSSHAVRQVTDMVGYRLTGGGNDEPHAVLRGENVTIGELYTTVVAELKRTAEQYLNQPVHKAVVTVPVCFTDAQRQAVREAVQRTGLEVLRIVQEPVAAGIAYGIGQGESKPQRIAVYSLGGGAFEFTLLSLRGSSLEVQAQAGDPTLGGEDFDRRILDWLIFGFAKDHKLDLRQDRTALQRVRDAVEKAKCELSSLEEVSIEVPFIISSGTSEPLHLVRTLPRSKLEELSEDLIDRTMQIARGALAEAGVEPQEVDTVLLVGGMTRMPRVQAAVQDVFGRTPSFTMPPEEVIALGAALQGAALVHVSEPPAAPVPVSPEKIAVQRALGLVVAGGNTFRLIEPGSGVPCDRRHIFSTTRDSQTGVRFLIVEGNSERGEENKLLGELLLEGMRQAPRGEPDIEIHFHLEENGTLLVSATNLETKEQRKAQFATHALDGVSSQSPGAGGGYTLEMKPDEELARTQQGIERLIGEIQRLLPRAELAVGASDMGMDAVRRARAAVERAKIAIIRGEPVVLLDTQNILRRTAVMLRGVTGGPTR